MVTIEPGRGIRCKVDGRLILVGSRAYLRGAGVSVPEFYKPPGTASDVLIAEAGEYIGRIQVADVLRPTAKAAMKSLKKLGIRTVLLTGDAPAIAGVIGRELGVDELKEACFRRRSCAKCKAFVPPEEWSPWLATA
jgi:Cd2+/Zn2+-exporting ATPase/Cu+-exporting ATPase